MREQIIGVPISHRSSQSFSYDNLHGTLDSMQSPRSPCAVGRVSAAIPKSKPALTVIEAARGASPQHRRNFAKLNSRQT